MRKITEKEYYKWRDTQSKIDVKVHIGKADTYKQWRK